MTLATEIEKNAAARTQLVRITVARHISGDLVAQGGGLYMATLPFDFAFAGVEFNSSSASMVAVVDTPNSNLEYRVNETNRTIEIFSSSVPDEEQVNFGLLFYLFFCLGYDRYLTQDPLDLGTTERKWLGRMADPLRSTQSFANALYGKITYSNSAVRIISEDSYLHDIFTARTTVAQREVKSWQFVGSTAVADGVILFKGRGGSPTFDRGYVSFPVYDNLLILDQTATNGDGDSDLYAHTGTVPRDQGTPLAQVFAPLSYYSTRDVTTVATTPQIRPKILDDGLTATVISYDTNIVTSTNRAWRCCRGVGTGGIATQTFGSITRTYNTGAGQRFFKFSSYTHLYVGHTISWTEAAVRYYGFISHVGAFTNTFDGLTYDIAVGFEFLPASTGSTMHAMPAIGAIIFGMSNAAYTGGLLPAYNRDFTHSTTLTSGGHNRHEITFTNNFEANHASSDTLDPETHTVKFLIAFSDSTDLTHGAIVSKLLTESGLVVNTASITAANAALTQTMYFQIPGRSEGAYGSYRQYLEAILKTTLAYVRVNDDDEVEYNLLTAPAPGYGVDEDNAVAMGVDLNYEDTIGTFVFDNPNLPAGSSAPTPGLVSTHAEFVAQLFGTRKTETFEHVGGPTRSPVRDDEIVSLRANRLATYRHRLAMQGVTILLGDNVTIAGRIVIGGVASIDCRVIGIEKGNDGVTITAADLQGI